MEYGTIEREIRVQASPEVAFAVVSRPEHLKEWWPDDAVGEAVVGARGELIWRDRETGRTESVAYTVVEVEEPRRFSFRWCYSDGDLRQGESLLVTFELTPLGDGTLIRLTESGFRELGWEAAVLEEHYREHIEGWNHFVPRLGVYVDRLVSAR
jgi:uncharacterized protein YndB with AHSA1/START domain